MENVGKAYKIVFYPVCSFRRQGMKLRRLMTFAWPCLLPKQCVVRQSPGSTVYGPFFSRLPFLFDIQLITPLVEGFQSLSRDWIITERWLVKTSIQEATITWSWLDHMMLSNVLLAPDWVIRCLAAMWSFRIVYVWTTWELDRKKSLIFSSSWWASRGSAVVRALASHQCGPGPIPAPVVICV